MEFFWKPLSVWIVLLLVLVDNYMLTKTSLKFEGWDIQIVSWLLITLDKSHGKGLHLLSVLILVGNLITHWNFFSCCLAAPLPTLGHFWGGSLSHLMLITVFCLCLTGGDSDPSNEVGSIGQLSFYWYHGMKSSLRSPLTN